MSIWSPVNKIVDVLSLLYRSAFVIDELHFPSFIHYFLIMKLY